MPRNPGEARVDQSVKLTMRGRRRLRLAAAYLDREISDIVEEALDQYFERLAQERQAQGLPPLPGPD